MAQEPIILERHMFEEHTSFVGGDIAVDGAGNTFMGRIINASNDTQLLVRRLDPQLQETGNWTITPSEGQKADSVSLAVRGSDLVVQLTAHTGQYPAPDPRRNYTEQLAVIEGVAIPTAAPAPVAPVYNEPCVLPNNLPYFRPGAPVTRGQLAKIAATLAAWMGVNMGTNSPQHFEDVPPGSPFYPFVQWCADHNIIGGYKCK